MDSLNISALSVSTKIGVYAWEQRINQRLFMDISINSDFTNCQDTLTNTLDYDALCKSITEYVESKSFQLIESVANEVAHLIKNDFKVSAVRVAVTKPHAVKNAGVVQVVVER